LSRKPLDLPAALRRASADLTDAATLASLPKQFAYVVYAASADTASDEAYRLAYVQGVSNLIRHLESEQVRRLFFVSSTAVYAQSDGSRVNEASATEPRNFSGLRTLEAERVVAGASFPTTILRCSGIYGPGRDRLVAAVRSQEAISVSERYTNRIHRDDIVGSVVHLIARGDAPGLLLLSDDEPVPQRAVIEYLAERLGLPLPPLAASADPNARGGNKRCDNGLLKSLGYTLRYPSYREGYAELLNT
jgi:nucleoside-diphosphate-sugar epimerase